MKRREEGSSCLIHRL